MTTSTALPVPAAAGVTWLNPLLRGAAALVTALVITFSGDHSARVGLLSFAAFAVVSALVLLSFGVLRAPVLESAVVRTLTLVQAAATLVAGVLAAVFWQSGTATLLYLVAVWAAVTGFIELYLGLRHRGRLAYSREWIFVGALTAVVAVTFVLVPVDFAHGYTIEQDGVLVDYVLDAAIVGTGVIGFYTAILGVYLVISGVSIKRAPLADAGTAPEADDADTAEAVDVLPEVR